MRSGPVTAAAAPAWTPLDLGSGLLVWFESDSIAQADNTAVSQWDDQSGNARHATQATGANQPTLQTGEIGGKPALRFDATDDSLATASIDHSIGFGDFAICAVAKTQSVYTLGLKRIISIGTSNLGYHGDTLPNLMSGNMYTNGDRRFNDNLGTNSWRTAIGTRVGTALTFYYNGTQDSDASNTSGDGLLSPNAFTIGNAFGSDIAAIAVYKGTLSTTDRQSLESYWRTKYGHY